MKLTLSRYGIILLLGLCPLAGPCLAASEDGAAVDDYNFAAWLYNEGKYGLAVESYQVFLENYGEHAKAADARFGLAQSFFHLEAFDKAVREYEALRTEILALKQDVKSQ